MSTLQAVELGVLGPLQVRQDAAPVMIPGAKPRAILTMLALHSGSVVSAETLIALLWGDDPPRTAAKALQTHISSLRRTLGDGFVLTQGMGWTLAESEVDASRYKSAARLGRDAAAAGDMSQAVARFQEALALWRGIPELPDGRRGTSEKTQWIEGHAALVEDRADALLATGRAAEIIGELEAAVAEAPLRERRWGQLMLALYRAGRQGDALGAYQRARSLLADELGVDPGSELRRLEAAVVAQDAALDIPVAQNLPSITRTVTFLLTDIEGSTAAWEADADAMAVALARHDELVEQVVTSRGGRLIKTRGEGDATFSVFERATAAAAAAIELQDAIFHEPWRLQDPMRIRVALHTGEVELRDGDYFGRAVNRAARLRSLAIGGQILCSGAIAELVIDALPDDVVLADLGMRQLKNLARPEHVFELRLETASDVAQPQAGDEPLERPGLPAVLTGPGPFVGRGRELERLVSAWQTAQAGGTHAVLIAGEPGVGKTRLAGEWSQQAYQLEAIVLYGRCDEDLGAPYQPFAEALRSLVPCLGTRRLRGMRGVEALLPLVPGLTDVLPDLAAPTRADPDTERYALFDAVVALLEIASTGAPVVLVLDDLHWAAKPTLLLLRHLLRFGDRARVQIVGTYRSTDLDRSHPLAAMLADLHRGAGSGTANRLTLSGLDEADVTTYVTEAGYNDEELARALASVTGGNPFFLIEALRHVDETGGVWDPTTLPQGVRETVSRRLSRLPAETNTALAAAAVVGSRFALDLVEKVVEQDLVDPFDEACKAGIVIEEPGGRYRFNHAIVRQSLLAELPSVRRMRLHQRIATTLENEPGADDELLAELAHHYFECAWAGNAAKAVEYCRRAADQAVTRLAYEGAADLYGQALHAMDEIDDELPDRDDQAAELLVARCEALLAAGDVASAVGAVSKLQEATVNSARLAAWATCFDGQLSMLIHPERLDEVENALGLAAQKLAELDDAAGEANAHTVRAACLARLGRIGDCEIALDDALTAARRARDHRRVNAVLAGAPLAALWGPNPVPRAGGRCLDVVRLLRITTDSPAVEATSTRCQAVLEAFRGRAEAARRMIDSARRTVAELGLRHALLEVEQFAGIVELVADDPAAAESHLRQAYNGFRRMGLDADTAETAALLGCACLTLDREAEADELCTESEHLAGHALKASIAWRTLRARLLSRRGDHGEARRVAEAAVGLAERTDALVDHGDACLSLATVLGTARDVVSARAAAERAVDLYERKGAAALAEKARRILGEPDAPSAPTPPEAPSVEPDNACVRAIRELEAAFDREAWDEVEERIAPDVFVESRRKIVGFSSVDVPSSEWPREVRRLREIDAVRHRQVIVAIRGERLALTRLEIGNEDETPGSPRDEVLQLYGLDKDGRIALQVFFDIEDIDAAIAELDAAQTRFETEQPKARRLDNAASQAVERYLAHFAARDWDALADVLAHDISTDDRRRVANAGIRHGRDAEIANLRAIADIGLGAYMTSAIVAARGERLTLARVSSREHGPERFVTDVLGVVEVNSHNQIAAIVVFDLYDFDSAIAELDTRYLAGEAAAHARTWSVITGTYASVNQHELPALTPDCVTIDHRRVTGFAPGELTAYIRAGWEIDQTTRTYVEVVHRLSDLGAVCTYAGYVVSSEGFAGEQRGVNLATVDSGMVNRSELFDEAGLDAALARFDQLGRPAPRLENAASQAHERYLAHFAARDWDALAKVLADDIVTDDRRRVVNAGIRHGRDGEIANLRAIVDTGLGKYLTSVVIAARGESLILARASGRDRGSAEFGADSLSVVEINSHNQIAVVVVFDLYDFDSAIAELDTRYLAGEAAAHARTWSVITRAHAIFNRGELPARTSDWVDIDHRPLAAIGSGHVIASIRATLDLAPDLNVYAEVVHRLTDIGAVVTHTARGTSDEGLDAEWRMIDILIVDGDLISRCEIFDEADLDAALARFEELHPHERRLQNAASQVYDRLNAYFATRDWPAMAELLADDTSTDDRRRVVNAGIRRGRDVEIANGQVVAEIGAEMITSTVIATRGRHLALCRSSIFGQDQQAGEFRAEFFSVVEIDADERLAVHVVFDLDDFDAAIAELDARYIAGEAADHAHMWSVLVRAQAAFNRHEFPAATPDWVNIDHQRGNAFAPGDLTANMSVSWNLTPDISYYIEAVHRLTNLGAVLTHAAHGTSRAGFEAEWRIIDLLTVEGNLVNRCEVFDEADLDAALARFDQLSLPAPRLENAASRGDERFSAYFVARDWDAMAELMSDSICIDDRRHVVNAGVRRGRDAEMANLRARAETGMESITSAVIAVRGERLALTRTRFWGHQQRPEDFHTEALCIIEIGSDERIVARVGFDRDDIGAAFAELDARYLAGEGAAHAGIWSVITGVFVAHNRREIWPATTDAVSIDHRRGAAFAPGEGMDYVRAGWDLGQTLNLYIETAHRVNDLGAVFTFVGFGTSHEGFAAEWRAVNLMTVDGEMLNRGEVFDEEDLDAALAKFDQLSRPAARLENAASRVDGRFQVCFAARDWDAMAEMLSDGFSVDDRRRVVNAGSLQGRDAELIVHAYAALGSQNVTSTVVATRAQRLALSRYRFSDRDPQPDAFRIEMLVVVEIDADERMAAAVVFDVDDFEGAIAELDARYLAGEAAAHARTWSVIAEAYAALNRHELPAATQDWVNVDHRRLAMIEAGDLTASIRAAWDLSPDSGIYVEAVHRLSKLGAVVTWAGHGTSREGFDAESQGVSILTVDGELVSRCELFDETSLGAALATFEELHLPARRLENAASRVGERYLAHIATGDWNAMAEILTDNFSSDDRRRVAGAGVRHGRYAVILDMRAIADLALMSVTSTVMATRGERLVLMGAQYAGRNRGPEGAFLTEVLGVFEIDADERIVAAVSFDVDNVEAAIAELDARYIAGEAADFAHTWSVIAGGHAALNRREPLPITPDCMSIDHRRGAAFAPGELIAYLRAGWDLDQNIRTYVEVVHRLSNLGAVCTHVGHGVSQEGFDAEWRGVDLLTVDGNMVNRCEVFNEADLDSAIAKFEQLSRPGPPLENAASQMGECFLAHFLAGDWGAMAEMLADNFSSDDRRRVVGAGVRHGRDAQIVDMRAMGDLWTTNVTFTVMATRGRRLVLGASRFSGRDQGPEAFLTELLNIVEIDADERIVASIAFDVDDIDAAFQELDARYLAGEAASHAHTWQAVTGAFAAMNRHELPGLTPHWLNIDHRRGAALAPGDMTAYIHALWGDTPDFGVYIEGVHRLSNFGAIVTHLAHGTSQEGFEAEWRDIGIFMFEGALLSRCELFDEADLDAALARFEELHPQAPRLENAASRLGDRFLAHFAASEWDAMAEMLADNLFTDDRRRVVGAGVRHGRDAQIVDMRALGGLWTANLTPTVMATRGDRLVLQRVRFSERGHGNEAFLTENLGIGEINADERFVAFVAFDLDDIDAAFEELDSRYLASEAAAHAHTWSVIMRARAALNRREMPPTTPDWVNIDHRRGTSFASGELPALLDAAWSLTTDLSNSIEAVHRLDDLGAVVTSTAHETSQEGFDAQWRVITFVTVEGDRINRWEVFDEADLDVALARFEDLHPQARRLANAATRVCERMDAYFVARDWDAMTEILADGHYNDDRRRVVNAGIRHGRDVEIANMRAAADLGATNITPTVIATRGERLALRRVRYSGRDQRPGAFHTEVLYIVEIDADERTLAFVLFDVDDIDAAFEELDARYVAGEAAEHAQIWSVLTRAWVAFNRHEFPRMTPDSVNIDHRPPVTTEAFDLAASLRAAWDVTPDVRIYIEAVHQLSELGAVVTEAMRGTSHEGFDAEWRMINISTVEGDLISRCELFDEADLDAALARFEELHPQARLLANAATQADQRFWTYFAARNWDAMAELLADDISMDDRRRIVNAGVLHGRDVQIANMRAVADLEAKIRVNVIATRGQRLAVTRIYSSNRDLRHGEFGVEILDIVEIDTDERISAHVLFEPDDINAAFAELDARYLAGEAATHSHTWSVIAGLYAGFNRHQLAATTPDYVVIDHRLQSTIKVGGLWAYVRAAWDLVPSLNNYVETVHRLSDLGAVVTNVASGTSQDGFDAEWRMIHLFTIDGDLISRCEMFDEADLDAALARFDELSRRAPLLENAATRAWARVADASNRRDMDGLLALSSADGRYEDRRKGLRDVLEGPARRKAVHAMFETAPTNWRMEVEPIAIRGVRLALIRTFWRDTDFADRPIVAEILNVGEVGDDDLLHYTVNFDPDDLEDAFAELTARWIASGEVAYPEVIESVDRINAAIKRHDWDAVATHFAAADYVNHRQLAHAVNDTIADWLSSMQATASLVPDLWVELAEVLARSAIGIVGRMAPKGTSIDGSAIDIPFVVLILLDGEHVTRLEAFDEDQRDLALTRFEELSFKD